VTTTEPLTIAEVGRYAGTVLDEVERAVVGKRDALELVVIGLLANGHILLEDFPGLAKTLMARSFAQTTGLDFARIQFTPDLMPSDITGSSIWNVQTSEFEFRAGPVFTNLVLGDEINRASPKTQAAMLEAMQERQVTIDGRTRTLDPPFLVIATQNPVEYEGTYPLPEAQLDRFLLRVGVGYPERDDEWEVLRRRVARGTDEVALRQVVDRLTLRAMQQAIEQVHLSPAVGYYIVDLVAATRSHPSVQVGSSPRGALALLAASRASAAMAGRDFVTPEDVKSVAVAALSHRLMLRPAQWVRGITGEQVVREVLTSVPTPPAEDIAQRPPAGEP
jgi:MoxR-like ATPase